MSGLKYTLTLDEFEEYKRHIDQENLLPLEQRLKIFYELGCTTSFRNAKRDFMNHLWGVDPAEDRDFLTLKYSDIITSTEPAMNNHYITQRIENGY